MEERHENEQYFFDAPTLARLVRFLGAYRRPCLLCAPLLGKEIAAAGRPVRILDVDRRFERVPGFVLWDINRPRPLDEEFDILLCDPPFFGVSLSRLFRALRLLARNRFDHPLLVSYLRRRSAAVLGTFAPFGLEPTGFRPGYLTVQPEERNDVEFYGNLGPQAHASLRALGESDRP